jgi:hypothetical protein
VREKLASQPGASACHRGDPSVAIASSEGYDRSLFSKQNNKAITLKSIFVKSSDLLDNM